MSNTVALKQENLLQLIRVLYAAKEATKPWLSQATGFAMPTVHNFISELLSANIVIENGSEDSRGGRRATRYVFNQNLFQILGVRMKLDGIDIGLFDLGLHCLRQTSIPVRFDRFTSEEGIELIIRHINDTLSEWSVMATQLLGIGVTFPGPVNPVKGIVKELPNLRHWKDVPAKTLIERAIHTEVTIEKDSLSNVIGLKWLQKVPENTNVAYLVIEMGVGIGLLTNGHLYRGRNCMMGEIGHISVDSNGPLCNCGNRGCLEFYASNIGVIQRAKERIQQGEHSILSSLCGNNPEKIDMAMILQAEKAGDHVAHTELAFCLKYIALCIIDVIKLYDPDQIIISHSWLSQYPAMFDQMLEYVFMNSLFARRDSIDIGLNQIPDLELIAAGATVLEYQFSDSTQCTFLKLCAAVS